MSKTATSSKIPANVRVMIGLVASPTLLVIGMLLYTLFTQGPLGISISMIIFSGLGLFSYFVVFTGRLPKFKQ